MGLSFYLSHSMPNTCRPNGLYSANLTSQVRLAGCCAQIVLAKPMSLARREIQISLAVIPKSAVTTLSLQRWCPSNDESRPKSHFLNAHGTQESGHGSRPCLGLASCAARTACSNWWKPGTAPWRVERLMDSFLFVDLTMHRDKHIANPCTPMKTRALGDPSQLDSCAGFGTRAVGRLCCF